MRRVVRLAIVLVSAAIVLALVIASWRWLVVHLSQETGTSNSSSRAYSFWSGFGANFGELALLGGIIAAYRHHNCHVKGCPRLGKPVEGTPYLACPRHHPDHHGHKRGVELELIHAVHRLAHHRHIEAATTASANTFGAATSITFTKEPPPMSLLDDIEKRFTTTADRVVSDAEAAARSNIGQTLLAAGKEILPLLPEGREASLVITKLEEVESWAHRALVAGAAVAGAAETVTSEVAPDAAPAQTAAQEPTDPTPPPAA